MPFPFAAVGAAIVSAVAGGAAAVGGAAAAAGAAVAGAAAAAGAAVAAASTTTLVIGGVSLVAGGALTAAAISARNEEKYNKAKAEAEQAASRANEELLVKQAQDKIKKLKEICAEYGENIPEELAQNIVDGIYETLASLEGNEIGLKKQNMSPSAEAVAAREELKKIQAELTLKK